MEYIEVPIIEKPLYGTFVYVRDIYLKKAERTGKPLLIRTSNARRVCTASEWKRNASRMEKTFEFPNSPMVLWGNYITPYIRKERVSSIIDGQQELFQTYEAVERKI